MAKKVSRGLVVAVGAGVVAALAVVGFILANVVSGDTATSGDEPPLIEMGPDMADAGDGGQTGGMQPPETDVLASVQSTTSPDPPVIPDSGPIRFEDATLVFEATFPADPEMDAVLAPLRVEAANLLGTMRAGARSFATDAKEDGREAFQWEVAISWKEAARAGGVVSLLGESSQFTGGAHPNAFFDRHIARIATGEAFGIDEMMVLKRSPSPAMSIAVCEGLKTEKMSRIGSETILGEPIVCGGRAEWVGDGRFVLAASTEADRFGGVHVLFEPYAVGAYAEGPYIVTIGQDVFAHDLRPDFRPLFGGAPVALGE